MSVARSIKIRFLTNFNHFSQFIEKFVNTDFTFNEDGTITSLKEDDYDDFDYIAYQNFKEVKNIMNKRESRNIFNYILIWFKELDESLSIMSKKLKEEFKGYKNHYEIEISLGYGKRITGADRYTDFGIYLNKIIPRFLELNCYICEIVCSDFDC